MVPVVDLRVGDVITFVPPESSSPVTHRIIAVTADEHGRPVFETQGDANEYADPWQVSLPGPVQARYSFQVPYLGYLLAALTLRPVRLLVLAVPAFVIGLSLLLSVWREAVAEARRERDTCGGRRRTGGGVVRGRLLGLLALALVAVTSAASPARAPGSTRRATRT